MRRPPLSLAPLVLLACRPLPSSAEFNFEVGLRVREALATYMSTPSGVLGFVSNYRASGAAAARTARNDFVQLGDALMKTYPHWMIYYGLETGELAGVFHAPRHGNYREPGDGAYAAADGNPHYMTCVGWNGTAVPCRMEAGDPYVHCLDGCALRRCADEDSQRDCSSVPGGEGPRASCEANVKWCRSYDIREVPEDDVPRGFVPLSYYCLDGAGLPTQEPGETHHYHGAGPGECRYDDKVTLVNRTISGEYAYCARGGGREGGTCDDAEGGACDTTFVGAFRSSNYDPRYRPWYIMAKKLQKPYWTPAYIFWESTDMGITYVRPIYRTDEGGRNVFEGVLALDYKFTDIGNFLRGSYQDTDTAIVAIVEEEPPHYVIATSADGIGSKTVLAEDPTQPCEADGPGCTSVRITADELDDAVSEAFAVQVAAGFPAGDLLPVARDGAIYASQTKPFDLPDDGVSWRILILSPVETLGRDAIERDDPLAAFVVAPSVLGFVVCSAFFASFLSKRHAREVIKSDYRFTGAFIFHCGLLNLACLSFVGENSDALCLLRMWLLHFFFVLALAPLLVKTHRMYMLVGGAGSFRRQSITHARATLMTVPFVLVEVAILIVFTFVDPSKETAHIEQDASTVTYRVVCAHDTAAFIIVQLVYEGALLLIGCALAFKTRNMPDDFGESKQLILAIYNIALVASIIIVLGCVAELYGNLRILVTVGVCWSTIFSSGVFVLPRLLQVQQGGNEARAGSVAHLRATIRARQDVRQRRLSFDVRPPSTENDCALEGKGEECP